MHEFSIADALAGQVERHAPPGRVVSVDLRVGPLRGLEPEAMRMAWDAVAHGTRMAGARLVIDSLPWTLACTACDRQWTSPEAFVTCACGNEAPVPSGGDELDLMSITVEPEEAPA
ncbi:MAG TPA: hydrogenase maturation nickel metallochaperone HypA [Candidatus Limnocylindrales bacterium]|nr:hydrogenase maturation nickel metallochaperone HypA [Candidatus Limnocylindrales bacterium]